MQRIVRPLIWVMFGLLLLALIVFLLSPSAGRLAPSWLYYDLVVRQLAPLPGAAERLVLAEGQNFCSVGRDSACGGYKVTNAHSLALGPGARAQSAGAAWCVDYVVLRRNTGRLSGQLIYWANIPGAMVITELNDGRYQSSPVARCDMTTLNP
jgi:hypothetical protein